MDLDLGRPGEKCVYVQGVWEGQVVRVRKPDVVDEMVGIASIGAYVPCDDLATFWPSKLWLDQFEVCHRLTALTCNRTCLPILLAKEHLRCMSNPIGSNTA